MKVHGDKRAHPDCETCIRCAWEFIKSQGVDPERFLEWEIKQGRDEGCQAVTQAVIQLKKQEDADALIEEGKAHSESVHGSPGAADPACPECRRIFREITVGVHKADIKAFTEWLESQETEDPNISMQVRMARAILAEEKSAWD